MAAVAGPLPMTEVLADLSALALTQHSQEDLFLPFCGTWIKDKEASHSMSGVCGLLGFSGIMQQAVKLIKGLDISLQGGTIRVSVYSFITWFKLSERYPVDGREVRNSRRDMRIGGMTTRLEGDAREVRLHMRWGGSYAGGALDRLTMPDQDTLHLYMTVWVHGSDSPASALQVYRRAG